MKYKKYNSLNIYNNYQHNYNIQSNNLYILKHLHHNLSKYFVYMQYRLMKLIRNVVRILDKILRHFGKYNNLNFGMLYIVY